MDKSRWAFPNYLLKMVIPTVSLEAILTTDLVTKEVTYEVEIAGKQSRLQVSARAQA